jgi:predicted HTH domain antitoxin
MTLGEVEPFQKYLFMLLYAKGSTRKLKEPIAGNLWLQKEMFLISKVLGDFEDEFEPYYLGPFSEKLEAYADQFESSDYIEKPGKILLKEQGEQIARKIWEQASEKDKEIVEDIKEFLNDLKDEEVLGYVYQSYPDMTEKSKVKDEIDKKLKEIAIRLFRKKKVSLEKASSIAGISLKEFGDLLKSHGVPAYSITKDELQEEMK